MGSFIVISIFAKLSDPGQTFVEANRTSVSIESPCIAYVKVIELRLMGLQCSVKRNFGTFSVAE